MSLGCSGCHEREERVHVARLEADADLRDQEPTLLFRILVHARSGAGPREAGGSWIRAFGKPAERRGMLRAAAELGQQPRQQPLLQFEHRRSVARLACRVIVPEEMQDAVDHEPQDFLAAIEAQFAR